MQTWLKKALMQTGLKKLKWLLIPVIPLLLAAGVQSYYWYRVTSEVEQLSRGLSPVARVRYDSLSAWLFFPVRIRNVEIQPANSVKTIPIKELQLVISDWLGFLMAGASLESALSQVPVGLRVKSLEYDLQADYARKARRGGAAANVNDPYLLTLACGIPTPVDAQFLMYMRYRQLDMDLTLDWQPLENNRLQVRFGTHVNNLGKNELAVTLGLVEGGYLNHRLSSARLQEASLSWHDQGFNRRWQQYCSREEDVPMSEYAAIYGKALEKWLGEYSLGTEDGLLRAFFSAHQSDVRITGHLKPKGVTYLASLERKGVAQKLLTEATFRVNNQPVQLNEPILRALGVWVDLPLEPLPEEKDTPDAGVSGSVIEEITEEVETLQEVVPGVVPLRPLRPDKLLQMTEYKMLPQYLGSQVKVKTRFAQEPVEGVLVAASSEAIKVRKHLEQGRAVIPISRSQVVQVEVYR